MRKAWIGMALVAANFLWAKPVDLQMGARPYGMGGAFTALSNDATAAYWNPAGLTQLNSITFSETQWLLTEVENVNVNYLNAIFPFGKWGAIGGGWLLQHALLESGDGDTYDESGFNESSFSLVAGFQLWESLGLLGATSVGFSLNRHMILADKSDGAGVGFDIGFLSELTESFRVGLVAKSAATDVMGDRVSPEYRFGMGYIWNKNIHKISGAMDLLFKEGVEYKSKGVGADGLFGTNQKVFMGVEYQLNQNDLLIGVRTGMYQWLTSFRTDRSFSAGFSLGYLGIRADYALQFFEDQEATLGQTHRITLEIAIAPFFAPKPADEIDEADLKGMPARLDVPEVNQQPQPKSFDPNSLIKEAETPDKK